MTNRGSIARVAILVVVAALALPAAAQATVDVALTQTQSATVVKPGGTVSIKVTARNLGDEATFGGYCTCVYLFNTHLFGLATDNKYVSVTASSGSCTIPGDEAYDYAVCDLGPLAPSASAEIDATVRVTDSMFHRARLWSTPSGSTYYDAVLTNNEARLRVSADIPPAVSGSKKLKLTGLPNGCVHGDFTLGVFAAAKGVKKVTFNMDLGFDETGSIQLGHAFTKTTKGRRLQTRVPISQFLPKGELGQPGRLYFFKLKAKRKNAPKLKARVGFERC